MYVCFKRSWVRRNVFAYLGVCVFQTGCVFVNKEGLCVPVYLCVLDTVCKCHRCAPSLCVLVSELCMCLQCRQLLLSQQTSKLLVVIVVFVGVQGLVVGLVLHPTSPQTCTLLPGRWLCRAGLCGTLLPPFGAPVLEPHLGEMERRNLPSLVHTCSLLLFWLR